RHDQRTCGNGSASALRNGDETRCVKRLITGGNTGAPTGTHKSSATSASTLPSIAVLTAATFACMALTSASGSKSDFSVCQSGSARAFGDARANQGAPQRPPPPIVLSTP